MAIADSFLVVPWMTCIDSISIDSKSSRAQVVLLASLRLAACHAGSHALCLLQLFHKRRPFTRFLFFVFFLMWLKREALVCFVGQWCWIGFLLFLITAKKFLPSVFVSKTFACMWGSWLRYFIWSVTKIQYTTDFCNGDNGNRGSRYKGILC